MPAVRSDYFTPISRSGEILGQAVSNVGQTIGNTVARIPEMRQKQEEYDMKMEEFRANKEYRIGEIERLKGQAQEFGKKINMPAKQYETMSSYFDDLKKAPADKAEKKLKNISFYLGNYAGLMAEAKDDPTLSGQAEMFNDRVGPSDWDDDEEISAIGKQFDGWKKDRKRAWVNTTLSEYKKQGGENQSQEGAVGYIVNNLPDNLKGKVDAGDIKEWVQLGWASEGEMQKASISATGAKLKEKELDLKGRRLSLDEDKVKGGAAKDNEKSFMDIRKETNSLIAKNPLGAPYEPGQDVAKDATVRQNLITLTLLSKGMKVQEASTKAAEIDEGLDPAKKAQILDYLKNKETVEASPGLFDKLGKLISGFVSSSSQGVGRSGAAIPGTPTAQPKNKIQSMADEL